MGLVAGGGIGYFFGRIQEMAQRRNQMREDTGKYKSGWVTMPSSMGRVAYLIMALVLVQIICPLMFTNGTQWSVSGGVALGYGYVLFTQLMRKRQEANNK